MANSDKKRKHHESMVNSDEGRVFEPKWEPERSRFRRRLHYEERTGNSEANQQITLSHSLEQNLPENGHDMSSTPGTSSQLITSSGMSPQSVLSLHPQSVVAQKSSAGGQKHNWEIDETVLKSVLPNAANLLSNLSRNGKIYEVISDKKKGILERLKELSHSNSEPSIDVALEMADGVYLLKLMNMAAASIDVAERLETARNMAERGAVYLQQAKMLRHKGEELLRECRKNLQSPLNVLAPATETVD